MSRKLDARAATFSPSLGAAAGVAGAAAAAAPLPPQENKPRSSASSAAGAGTQVRLVVRMIDSMCFRGVRGSFIASNCFIRAAAAATGGGISIRFAL